MRPLFFPALNRFVGNEPGVAATAPIAAAGVRPARDVALVLIRDAEREPIERRLPVVVRWKTYSWQSFRKRGELIGLK